MKGKKLACLLALCLAGITAKAQTNFLEGYYISLSNDTIRGFIEYRSQERNFNVCVYRATLNSSSVRLLPEEIKGFAVLNKDFYEANSYTSKRSELLRGFFRVLVKGKLTLLSFGDRYFVKTNSGEIYDISKTVQTGNKKSVNSYGIGMLKVLTKDCSAVSTLIDQLSKQRNINYVELFKIYNTSCSNEIFFEAKKIRRRPEVDLGVQVGLTYTSLDLGGSFKDADLKYDASVTVGGFASVFIPRIPEKLRFMIEFSGGYYNQYAYFTSTNTNNDLFIKYSYIQTPVFIRYSMNHVFLDAGFFSQFKFKQDLTWRTETMIDNEVFTASQEVTPFDNAGGFLLGIGTQFKVFSLPVRSTFRFSKNLKNNTHEYVPNAHSFNLILSVQLTR